MGTIQPPAQVKLFCALLIAPTLPLNEIETVLAEAYGVIVLRSTPMPFTQTTYYEREMGANLTRLYIAFDTLVSIAALAAVKHMTHQLEARWSTPQGQRRVNIDPGYLDLAKVVLASTKDHRLSGQARARTRPGTPAPEPRSTARPGASAAPANPRACSKVCSTEPGPRKPLRCPSRRMSRSAASSAPSRSGVGLDLDSVVVCRAVVGRVFTVRGDVLDFGHCSG